MKKKRITQTQKQQNQERVKNSFDNSSVPERKNKERKGTQTSEVPTSTK